MSNLHWLPAFFLLFSCNLQTNNNDISLSNQQFNAVYEIPPPEGYKRMQVDTNSFGEWLRAIHLKDDNRVYLYNGSLKENQHTQFAVLDITVGKKDLQQCADAVMRLRAEYLYSQKRYSDIAFMDNNGKSYSWKGEGNRNGFNSYLENVFGWCGSASLEKQLRQVEDVKDLKPGDVFIKGGFPGHAMIVADVAINDKGKKIFMLAQSYMPAQDIHIVKNPVNSVLSPWYEMEEGQEIITPEWIFEPWQLKKW